MSLALISLLQGQGGDEQPLPSVVGTAVMCVFKGSGGRAEVRWRQGPFPFAHSLLPTFHTPPAT